MPRITEIFHVDTPAQNVVRIEEKIQPQEISAFLVDGLAKLEELPDGGGVPAGSIPAGKKIFCYFLGEGGEIEPVYAEMEAYAGQRGCSVAGSYEYFLNGPEFGPEKLLNKIVFVLESATKHTTSIE